MVETSGSTLLNFIRAQNAKSLSLEKSSAAHYAMSFDVHGEGEKALLIARQAAKQLRRMGFRSAVEVEPAGSPRVYFYAPPQEKRKQEVMLEAIYAHMQEQGLKPQDQKWLREEHNPTISGTWGARQWEHVAFIRRASQRE